MPSVSTAINLVARFEVSDLIPQKGEGLDGEIKCYSLPYGALGFVSHVLTYYTIFCFWAGRSPLWPKNKLSYAKFGMFLGAVGLILTLAISIFTIVRCQNAWQLLVIAVWKMSMSLLNGIVAVHVNSICKAHKERGAYEKLGKKTSSTAWWISLYLPGMFAGMTGLMSLVVQNFDIKALRILTIVFYSVVGVGLLLAAIGLLQVGCKAGRNEYVEDNEAVYMGLGGFTISVVLFTVLAALYGDWALGIMTHNLVGLPSGDNMYLYWTYFAAKRLPMFSM